MTRAILFGLALFCVLAGLANLTVTYVPSSVGYRIQTPLSLGLLAVSLACGLGSLVRRNK